MKSNQESSKVKVVLLLLITSGVLFNSMLPLNDIEFVPKGAVNTLGSVRMSLIHKNIYKNVVYKIINIQIRWNLWII